MTGEAAVRAMLRRSVVSGPAEAHVDGHAVTGPPLVDAFADALYRACYTGMPWQPAGGSEPDAELLAELARANAVRERWEHGWRFVRTAADGRAVAERGAALRGWWPGHWLRDDDGYGPPVGGTPLRLLHRASLDVPGGFWFFTAGWGGADPDARRVRVYFNVDRDVAPALVAHVTGRLDSLEVPFHLKVAAHEPMFVRPDCAVLYVEARHFAVVAVVGAEVVERVPLGGAVPPFSKPLAPGVGFAEDPADGRSFGERCCRLVAAGAYRAWERGEEDDDARLRAVAEAFAAAGLDLDRPWLASRGAPDRYELPGGALLVAADREAPGGDALLAAAGRIGARLCREALWAGDRCAWVAPAAVVIAEPTTDLHLCAVGPSLYDGTAGIALFLAELYALTGEPVFRRTALGAAAHAVSRLEDVPPEVRLGLHAGWTGIAHAVERVGEVLGVAQPGEPARDAVARLVPPPEAALDVVGGSAGAIPALLALAARTGDDRLVPLAEREGRRLVAAAHASADGLSWGTIEEPEDPHLFGAAHGAAGIGAALIELAAHTGDDRFADAGRRAFAFESARFDAAAGTPPDVRRWVTKRAGGDVFDATWCHGAAGAALTRLRAWQLDGDRRLREEAVAALAACRRAATADDGRDDVSLCHGAAALGEALTTGAGVLGDADLEQAARASADRIAAAMAGGDPPVCGLPSGHPVPGLMLGEAGIGHHFLRLVAPQRVAPILQLAAPVGAAAPA